MVTNWGEYYNRESMYDTTRDYFIDGECVQVNGKKCQSLIDVMMEDLKMEIDKEEKFLNQATSAMNSNDDRGFLKSFYNTMKHGEISDLLIDRLRKCMVESNNSTNEYSEFLSISKQLRNMDTCAIEELKKYRKKLISYQKHALEYGLYGDGVSVSTSKILKSLDQSIQNIDRELYYRQIDYSDEKEC